jgi:hypothetical protein
MMLNIGAIKYCLEQYKCHATHEKLDIPDEHYREAIRTLKEIQFMLIERVAATHSREQLVARIKDIKIQELKTRLKDKRLEDVIGDLLASGFYPLDDECETIMSEQVGMADHVILP